MPLKRVSITAQCNRKLLVYISTVGRLEAEDTVSCVVFVQDATQSFDHYHSYQFSLCSIVLLPVYNGIVYDMYTPFVHLEFDITISNIIFRHHDTVAGKASRSREPFWHQHNHCSVQQE